jgi:Fe-S-cluster containining protein
MVSEPVGLDAIFHCTRCGQCCRGFGGTYLSGRDVEAIADYMAISPQRLIADYCTYSGRRLVLIQRSDGYCVFWNQLCTIHPVKPPMCRRWPLLRSVLVDAINWRSMASICPGIKIDARMDQVRECIEAYLSAEQARPPQFSMTARTKGSR